jgi:hypothetical protein
MGSCVSFNFDFTNALQVHSDANLNLIPAVVPYCPNNHKMPIIAKIERYSSPNILDKNWEFDTDPTSWSPGTREDEEGEWPGPWGDQANWEFRSAGTSLAICDDNNGEKPSTVTCQCSRLDTAHGNMSHQPNDNDAGSKKPHCPHLRFLIPASQSPRITSFRRETLHDVSRVEETLRALGVVSHSVGVKVSAVRMFELQIV